MASEQIMMSIFREIIETLPPFEDCLAYLFENAKMEAIGESQ